MVTSTTRSGLVSETPRQKAIPDLESNVGNTPLVELTRFFLAVCIDQVDFMESLVQPDRLRSRVLIWAEEEIRAGGLPTQAGRVLEAVLHRGELPRGEVDAIAGTGDRQGRRILAALIAKGVLASEGLRAPLHLAFPANLAQRWMPGLFPERAE